MRLGSAYLIDALIYCKANFALESAILGYAFHLLTSILSCLNASIRHARLTLSFRRSAILNLWHER